MPRQAAAAGGPAEARSVRRPSSSSRKRRSSSSSSSSNDSDVLVDEVVLHDPTEERIEAEIMAHLFRGAAPEAHRQAVAQQEALRAETAALRWEVAESRAQVRSLRAYTDLLKTDVSGYTEQQVVEYRLELQRRSNECFALSQRCTARHFLCSKVLQAWRATRDGGEPGASFEARGVNRPIED